MSDHGVSWILGAVVGAVATFATRVQLLPDVIDLSIIPTGAGCGSLVLCAYGAARGFGPERLARVMMFGTLLGAVATMVPILLALLL